MSIVRYRVGFEGLFLGIAARCDVCLDMNSMVRYVIFGRVYISICKVRWAVSVNNT